MNKKTLIALIVAILAAISPYSLAEELKVEGSAVADIFTADERAVLDASEQKFEFQAEVNRLMDILINSLYSNRDIFIRELISNCADALDKVRFLSLTDKEALGDDDVSKLDIRIKFDKEKRTLTISDKGIGMTKDELIKNLGVLARSGTTEFVEAAASGNKDTLSLIGQFGVGFYSVYLAADKVTVTSKSNKDDQYVWESTANSVFSIAKDPRGNTLGRGTEITMYLKADADEFLNERTLTDVVSKYSQFIDFPIVLQVPKTVTEEVEVEDDSEPVVNEDGVEVSEDKPKKTEKVTRTVIEDKHVNAVKAIWTRSANEVTDDEYNEFYRVLTKDRADPLRKLHFAAEGDIAFKSILYVPAKADAGLYDRYYEKHSALKLYVRRVLISDDWKDMLPRYLNFVKGVVDADDLPLNVNREQLSQSRTLKVISKKVHRKVLDMLKKLADEEVREIEDAADAEANPDAEAEAKPLVKAYSKFWAEFGKSIKLGVLEDQPNKAALTKLLRFPSSKGDDLVSLEQYVERMGEKQKSVFYLTGESMDAVSASPFLERAKAKGIEVLMMADPLDEYLVQQLTEFDGTPLVNLAKEGVELGDEKKHLLKQQQQTLAPLTAWLKELYGARVEKVVVSQRLGAAPLVLSTGQHGWSANMERIMRSQAFADNKQAQYMASKKVVEVNPYHPVIKKLLAQVSAGDDATSGTDLAELLYDSALVASGFSMDKPDAFAARVQRVVASALGAADEALEEEPLEDIDAPEGEAESVEEVNADEPTPAGNVYTVPSEDIKVSFGNDHDEL